MPITSSSSTAQFSLEYLMAHKKQRAALYVRESDINLALDSTTMESAVNALLAHAQKEGYLVDPCHIFKEAISGFHTYYFDRPELMKMLKCAERKEFDVLLVTEIRALSRRGAGEVLVIYNSLQKANVRLETLNEKITDDPMGEVLLSFRASWARIEREQSFLRMERGKKDRIEIGKAPPNGKRCYGYLLVDTAKEVKGQYVFNEEIIYVDREEIEWSEIKVRRYILDRLLEGMTLRSLAMDLNERGIPPPQKPRKGIPCWDASTVRRIAEQPINHGEVWVNQNIRVGGRMKKRPRDQWILLEGIAPALIDKEIHNRILQQMAWNKEEALRNHQHKKELGLLRCGYIFCAVCGRKMNVEYPAKNQPTSGPAYRCRGRIGGEHSLNHKTQIHIRLIDNAAKEKIREALLQPEVVRQKVAKIRAKNRPVVNEAEILEAISKITQKIKNLVATAENATDEETVAGVGERIQELEKEKRAAHAMLSFLDDDAEEREKIEKELQRFETWAASVQPFLTDPAYLASASYDELRLAVRILGIRVTVYPTSGDWPYRYQIEATVPEVIASIVGQSSH